MPLLPCARGSLAHALAAALSCSTRPSRMAIWRGSAAASSRSWVITAIVAPSLRVQVEEQARGWRRPPRCRGCPSARRRARWRDVPRSPGRSPRAGARPPRAASGGAAGGAPRPTRPEGLGCGPPALGIGTSRYSRPVGHVVESGSRHRAGRTAGRRSRWPASAGPRAAVGQPARVVARHVDAARRRPVERAHDVQQRRLAGARGPAMATSSPAWIASDTPRRASTGGSPGYVLTTSRSSRTVAALTAQPRQSAQRPARSR